MERTQNIFLKSTGPRVPRNLSNKVSQQLKLVFYKSGNAEEIPRDWKSQSLNSSDSRITPSNHGLLSLRTQGKIQRFCSLFFHLKDTLPLTAVQCQLTWGKKSSQKGFFFLSIQAHKRNRTMTDFHGVAHVEHSISVKVSSWGAKRSKGISKLLIWMGKITTNWGSFQQMSAVTGSVLLCILI